MDSADAVNFETLNFHIGGLLDSLALKWEKHDISIDQLVKQQRNSSDSFTKEREALDARINELKEQQQLEPTDSLAKQLEEKLVNTINKKSTLSRNHSTPSLIFLNQNSAVCLRREPSLFFTST
uniref:Uncharacterized protein n=1 Tax=Trichogramma kaykai TaxID=54128 RepID=A0ABD2WIU6_9HYME